MNWPLFNWSIRQGSRHLSEAQIRGAYRFVSPKPQRMILKPYRATDPENFRGWEERLLELTAAAEARYCRAAGLAAIVEGTSPSATTQT